ncbi:hypothetical protein [Phenylobacterium sp.]|uniref:hypothetical protein n=1 Tax=Phenylobacterium sp. TaxID=1871053 RepID=UPI0025FB5763|nr:hypothetical protein [Phenylobacterium sp.]
MPTSPIVLSQIALAIAAVAFALWKGGSPERATGAVVGLNVAVGLLTDLFLDPFPDLLRLGMDALTGLLLLWIVMRWGATWMGAIMFLYAGQFALHAYYLSTGRDQSDYLHAVINNADNTAIVLCLIAATTLAWRRRGSGAAA